MFKLLSITIRIASFFAALIFVAYSFNTLIEKYPPYVPPISELAESFNASASTQEEPVVAEEVVHNASNTTYGFPARIQVERVGIDLQIDPGYYDYESQTWTLFDDYAFFATLSDLPSDLHGNTVIYAHNRDGAFAHTEKMEPGDIIKITLDTGDTLFYKYFESEQVVPEDASIFFDSEYKNISRLTLLTCDGDFNEVRRLMFAELVSVQKV